LTGLRPATTVTTAGRVVAVALAPIDISLVGAITATVGAIRRQTSDRHANLLDGRPGRDVPHAWRTDPQT